ncbi:MAG: SMC-Scp complex subunit ScpB [Thermoguttaceae bacterium]|nr:SMC-Scp complex subunit ScpB [Thermoguttaceae bacterium]MBQ3333666.1 SMC-Scp complex subunit ScpB [Thermoguttaceae bacterium]MBQ6619132.1 SMC-Scp complex subunit ScpB [Thermoguttaceae bacterium]MBR2584646.1 SMC-Scp complex subunit ScpB [Thermoguttaceae bacterium]
MAELTDTARLEAALFLAREPVSGRRLANLAGIADPGKVRSLLRELNRRYLADNSAFGVVEVADGYQLRTRPEFAPWLFRLQEVPIEVRLSPAAMETLSIIAYRQPILRAKIEEIRGVQCGDILRQLMEMDLIRITDRLEEPGRPFLYGTTKKFLQIYGLVRLSDLPGKDTDSP